MTLDQLDAVVTEALMAQNIHRSIAQTKVDLALRWLEPDRFLRSGEGLVWRAAHQTMLWVYDRW